MRDLAPEGFCQQAKGECAKQAGMKLHAPSVRATQECGANSHAAIDQKFCVVREAVYKKHQNPWKMCNTLIEFCQKITYQ